MTSRDARQSPSKKNTQPTLHEFFHRYQAPPNFDAVAQLKSRARLAAERRQFSSTSVDSDPHLEAKPEEERSVDYRHGGTSLSVDMAIMANGSNEPRQIETPPSLESVYLSPLAAINQPNRVEANTTSSTSDLKRKNSQSHSSSNDDGPRPAKRSRSNSAEPTLARPTSSSTASLSTAPATSQLSVPSSLKTPSFRLSQDAPAYVPSSQSDENLDLEESVPEQPHTRPRYDYEVSSDSESDTSQSSLESLGDILAKFKARAPRRSAAFAGSYNAQERSSLTSGQPPNPNSKFSLGNLVRQHKRDLDAQVQLSKAELELNDSGSSSELPDGLDKALLATVVKQEDGADDVDRLLQAMDRTDAMKTEIAWRFFDGSEIPTESLDSPPFPALPGDLSKYQRLFKDRSSRDSAFLTGFAGDVMASVTIPDELQQWLWQSATVEPREDLADAYIPMLKLTTLSEPFDLASVAFLFEIINGESELMNPGAEICPISKKGDAPRRPYPKKLPRILHILTELSASLSTPAKTYGLDVLLRLAIDTEATNATEVRLGLFRSIAALVESLTPDEANEALVSAGEKLQVLMHPVLQLRLLNTVPATTPRLHLFRRRLALAFFLSSRDPLKFNPSDTTAASRLSDSIIAQLETNPLLQIADPTAVNYRDLAATIAILDIAVDSGFLQGPVTGKAPSSSIEDKINQSANSEASAAAKKSIQAHNAAVDAISAHAERLAACIVDTGASHMARTEAKAVLERLVCRLDAAVRTEPKRKTMWAEIQAKEAGQKRMDAFLTKTSSVDGAVRGVTDMAGGGGGTNVKDDGESDDDEHEDLDPG